MSTIGSGACLVDGFGATAGRGGSGAVNTPTSVAAPAPTTVAAPTIPTVVPYVELLASETEMVTAPNVTEGVLNVDDKDKWYSSQALVTLVSGQSVYAGLEPTEPFDSSDLARKEVQVGSGGNPALKGLKGRSPASTKKPVAATRLAPKVLPMSVVLGEESEEEEESEGGEDEEDDEEEDDEEDVDGEGCELTQAVTKKTKMKRRAAPKRKAAKAKAGKHHQTVKKLKTPVAERISTAKNTRTAVRKSS